MITNYFKTLSCRRVAPLLFAQSQNAELSPGDAAKLSAHLAHCAACQTEAAQFTRIARELRQATPKAPLPSADLWSRIEAEITTGGPHQAPQRPIARPNPLAPRLNGLAWAGSAAIVFVGGAWMTFGAGLWGHGGSGSVPNSLPVAARESAPDRTNVTLTPPLTNRPASSVASGIPADAATVAAKAAARQALAREQVRPAPQSAHPDPFAPSTTETAEAARPAAGGLAANRESRAGRARQTDPTTLGALARLNAQDARRGNGSGAERSSLAATVASPVRGFGAAASEANHDAASAVDAVDAVKAAPTSADGPSKSIAMVTPSGGASEGDPIAAITPAPPAPLPTTGVASAAPLGISAAFAYSSVKSSPEAERASDAAPTLDDAEPRTIPPAGSGGAFSVGEPTSRIRRQRALFSYGRP